MGTEPREEQLSRVRNGWAKGGTTEPWEEWLSGGRNNWAEGGTTEPREEGLSQGRNDSFVPPLACSILPLLIHSSVSSFVIFYTNKRTHTHKNCIKWLFEKFVIPFFLCSVSFLSVRRLSYGGLTVRLYVGVMRSSQSEELLQNALPIKQGNTM